MKRKTSTDDAPALCANKRAQRCVQASKSDTVRTHRCRRPPSCVIVTAMIVTVSPQWWGWNIQQAVTVLFDYVMLQYFHVCICLIHVENNIDSVNAISPTQLPTLYRCPGDARRFWMSAIWIYLSFKFVALAMFQRRGIMCNRNIIYIFSKEIDAYSTRRFDTWPTSKCNLTE